MLRDMNSGERKNPFQLWLPAVGIIVVTWLVFWMAQSFAAACALAYPCVGAEARLAPALLFGGVMLIPLALVLLAARPSKAVRWVARLGYVALVALAAVGYWKVCFAAGFVSDPPVLIGALAICGTVWLAFLGISALTRDSQVVNAVTGEQPAS
jgi:hypothetical protein